MAVYKQPCSLYPNHIRICEAEPPHTQGGTQDSWHLLHNHQCSCGRCSRSSCRGPAQCTTRRDLRQRIRHRPRNSSGNLIASTKHFKYINTQTVCIRCTAFCALGPLAESAHVRTRVGAHLVKTQAGSVRPETGC